MSRQRIWELDALRGLCVLGMVAVHLIYDLVEVFQVLPWTYPAWFRLIKEWGGVLFLLISGICVTLGSRSVRRGAIVFACGMICTAVTWGLTFVGFQPSIAIWFGVLHCLGVCMMLWPLFRRLPWWALACVGAAIIGMGFYVSGLVVDTRYLIPLGLEYKDFASSDYFPLLPHLGFFLVGAALGRTLYKNKRSLLPQISDRGWLVRPLAFCGRHSLWIYLLHQPVIYGALTVIL